MSVGPRSVISFVQAQSAASFLRMFLTKHHATMKGKGFQRVKVYSKMLLAIILA